MGLGSHFVMSFLPPVFCTVLWTHCSCHLFATNHVYMILKLSTLSLVVWAVLQFPVRTANSQAHLKLRLSQKPNNPMDPLSNSQSFFFRSLLTLYFRGGSTPCPPRERHQCQQTLQPSFYFYELILRWPHMQFDQKYLGEIFPGVFCFMKGYNKNCVILVPKCSHQHSVPKATVPIQGPKECHYAEDR